MPTLDENYEECTILKDFLEFDFSVYGPKKRGFQQRSKSVRLNGLDENIYYMNYNGCIGEKTGTPLAYLNDEDSDIIVAEKCFGQARVIFRTVSFQLMVFSQVNMLRLLLERLGVKETVYHSNEHVFTSLVYSTISKRSSIFRPLKTEDSFELTRCHWVRRHLFLCEKSKIS